MKTRTILAVLAAAAFAQGGTQSYGVQFKPVKGAKTVYFLSFDIESPGHTLVYQAKLTNEVVEVKGDGTFLTASYQSEGATIVDGNKQPSPAETITAVTTYDKYGRPTAIGGDNATPESFRVANLTSFIAPQTPVAIGESWSVKIEANPEAGTREVMHAYKLLAVESKEGKETAVIEMAVAEVAPDYAATAKGKVWVEISTGEQTKFELVLKNMPIGVEYVNGKVTIVRQ